jgi:predicted DNA-binding transcriptional regulator AlpA
MKETTGDCELIPRREVARLLWVTGACLRNWRRRGLGPPWLRVGKRLVRYDVAELRKWITERAGVQEGR